MRSGKDRLDYFPSRVALEVINSARSRNPDQSLQEVIDALILTADWAFGLQDIHPPRFVRGPRHTWKRHSGT